MNLQNLRDCHLAPSNLTRPPPPCPIARPTPHHSMARSTFRKGGSSISASWSTTSQGCESRARGLPCYKKRVIAAPMYILWHGRAGMRVLSFYIENGAQISSIIYIARCRVLICLRMVSYEGIQVRATLLCEASWIHSSEMIIVMHPKQCFC
jgi:hypothetical protein